MSYNIVHSTEQADRFLTLRLQKGWGALPAEIKPCPPQEGEKPTTVGAVNHLLPAVEAAIEISRQRGGGGKALIE